jgi:hypothetical protein
VPKAVREAVAVVRKDVRYAGGPHAPAEDTPDERWLSEAARRDWVVIARDKRLRRRKSERRQWRRKGLGVFALTSSGNLTIWQTAELLISRFDEIEAYARDHEGPYVVSVTRQGLRRLEPDGDA